MQTTSNPQTVEFGIHSVRAVEFGVSDIRLRRPSLRKIVRSLALELLQEKNVQQDSIHLVSDCFELSLRDLANISPNLTQKSLISVGDLFASLAHPGTVQIACAQKNYAHQTQIHSLLLDPLSAIEGRVAEVAKKHLSDIKIKFFSRFEGIRPDRAGHFSILEKVNRSNPPGTPATNPLTLTAFFVDAGETKRTLKWEKRHLRSEPHSFEVFKELTESLRETIKSLGELDQIWISVRDDLIAGRIIQDLVATEESLGPKIKYLRYFDRLSPFLLSLQLGEPVEGQSTQKRHAILVWDYTSCFEVISL